MDKESTVEPGKPQTAGAWDKLREGAGHRWVWLRPRFRQAGLNLRIWLPVLQNPRDRERLVKYAGREHREGLVWSVTLPRQCWSCGATDNLWHRQYEIDLRSFEYPLEISGGTLGVAAFVLLLAWGLHSFFWLACASALLAAGAGALWLKSWVEETRLSLWTCPTHAAEMRFPGAVVDQNDLYLFLPTDRLAQAARNELAAQRRTWASQRPGAGGDSGGPIGDFGSEPRGFQPRYAPPPVADLPPIKLAGDDDESRSSP